MVSMPLATSPPVLLDGATASPPTDNYTTALAALIAGSSDHDFGGAAPGSPLLAISVLDENLNATNAAIAAGVDRAALGGARVTCLAHGSMERSEVIDDALADAVEAGSWSSWAERWCGRHDHRCLCRRPPCHGRAGIPMSREQLGRPVK
jgi:hypothetical protein